MCVVSPRVARKMRPQHTVRKMSHDATRALFSRLRRAVCRVTWIVSHVISATVRAFLFG